MPLDPPEPDVPALRQPSEPEHGSSLGQDASCHGKADGLHPNLLDWSSYYSCMGGWLCQQSNPRSLVFSSSCNSAPGVESPRPLQPQHLGKGPGPFHTHLPSAPWRLELGFLRLSSSKRCSQPWAASVSSPVLLFLGCLSLLEK